MRKAIFWTGWAVLILIPLAFIIEIALIQDLPVIQPWRWAVLTVAVLTVIAARNRDDVLNHHLGN